MPDDDQNGVPDDIDVSAADHDLAREATAAQHALSLDTRAAVERIAATASAEHRALLHTLVDALNTGAMLLRLIPDKALSPTTRTIGNLVVSSISAFLRVLANE